MSKTIKIVLVTFLLIQWMDVINAYKEWWEDAKVMELTTDNFFENVGKDKYVVVKFYTRWCGYCRIMAPEYEKLFENMKNKRDDLIIARLEGSINEDISLIYEIFSFPKVVMFFPGSVDIRSSFRGQRVASVMESWVEQNSPKIEKNLKILTDSKNKENDKKDKSFDIEDAKIAIKNDKTNVTDELEFIRRDMMNMKNKIINLEKEIENLKNYTKKIDENVILNAIKSNEINQSASSDSSESNEEKIKKLKLASQLKKIGDGFFDRITISDIVIVFAILLFIVGTVITIKKIVFKNGKGIVSTEHVKV